MLLYINLRDIESIGGVIRLVLIGKHLKLC